MILILIPIRVRTLIPKTDPVLVPNAMVMVLIHSIYSSSHFAFACKILILLLILILTMNLILILILILMSTTLILMLTLIYWCER